MLYSGRLLRLLGITLVLVAYPLTCMVCIVAIGMRPSITVRQPGLGLCTPIHSSTSFCSCIGYADRLDIQHCMLLVNSNLALTLENLLRILGRSVFYRLTSCLHLCFVYGSCSSRPVVFHPAYSVGQGSECLTPICTLSGGHRVVDTTSRRHCTSLRSIHTHKPKQEIGYP